MIAMRSVFSTISAFTVLWSVPVSAFECTPATNPDQPDAPVVFTQAWNQRCIPFRINADSDLLVTARNIEIVRQSFDAWSNETCTDLNLDYFGITRQGRGFDPGSADNENVVLTTSSVPDPDALIGDTSLLAITVNAYSVETGEIFDADIILNDTRFQFVDVSNTTACRPDTFDLRNTLTHEVGHFLGFDHTPDVDATMFASAAACEIRKRDLGTTDLNGLCTVYPAGRDPNTCVPPGAYATEGAVNRFRNQCARESGCMCMKAPVGGRRFGWTGVVFLIGGLVLLLAGRRSLNGR